MSKWDGTRDAPGCGQLAVYHGPQYSACDAHAVVRPWPRGDGIRFDDGEPVYN